MRLFGAFVGFILLIFSLSATPAQAICQDSVGSLCPPGNWSLCDGGDKCCQDEDECSTTVSVETTSQSSKICDSVGGDNRGACVACMENDNPGVWTAIGCINDVANPTDFIEKMLALGVGIAGGIAFLLILFGGLQILTSAGNPEQLNAGRELVSSAVTGLLLIIFSIFLLQFIGVTIIGIPRFQ